MKRAAALLMCMVMVFALTGCNLFASGGSAEPGSTSPELKITDTVTHKDPENVKFAKRYAYYSGESFVLADAFKETYDAEVTTEFLIIYADENDRAVAQYTYMVFANSEDANKYAEGVKEYGMNPTVTENVSCDFLDAAGITTNTDTFIAMNVLTDYSAESYVKNLVEMDSLVEYNPE